MNDARLTQELRAHLDAQALTSRELDDDLARVLARRARRRSLFVSVAAPAAFAMAAAAVFIVLRAPPPPPEARGEREHVFISIADAGDPSSAIVLDFFLGGSP